LIAPVVARQPAAVGERLVGAADREVTLAKLSAGKIAVEAVSTATAGNATYLY